MKNIETKETARLKNLIALLERQMGSMHDLAEASEKGDEHAQLKKEFQKQIDAFRQGK